MRSALGWEEARSSEHGAAAVARIPERQTSRENKQQGDGRVSQASCPTGMLLDNEIMACPIDLSDESSTAIIWKKEEGEPLLLKSGFVLLFYLQDQGTVACNLYFHCPRLTSTAKPKYQ
jgi:hypothetical protein